MRYPIFLDLSGLKVVVVGAGRVATRKIRTLLAAKAVVTVISPKAISAIRHFAQKKRLRLVRRRYRAGDLRGARLVIAATNAEEVNKQVCADAIRRKILVNCAAPPAAGNFIVPSIVRRGTVTIAISTGGASPALAKQMRRELEQFIGDGYAEAAKKLRALRTTASRTAQTAKKRGQIYRRAVRRLLKSV